MIGSVWQCFAVVFNCFQLFLGELWAHATVRAYFLPLTLSRALLVLHVPNSSIMFVSLKIPLPPPHVSFSLQLLQLLVFSSPILTTTIHSPPCALLILSLLIYVLYSPVRVEALGTRSVYSRWGAPCWLPTPRIFIPNRLLRVCEPRHIIFFFIKNKNQSP